MNHDYSKRDYLLPKGCKHLIDALKQEAQAHALHQQTFKPAAALPPLKGEIVVPDHATTLRLASILGQKPFRIIADLMDIGIFANVNQELDFDTITKITR